MFGGRAAVESSGRLLRGLARRTEGGGAKTKEEAGFDTVDHEKSNTSRKTSHDEPHSLSSLDAFCLARRCEPILQEIQHKIPLSPLSHVLLLPCWFTLFLQVVAAGVARMISYPFDGCEKPGWQCFEPVKTAEQRPSPWTLADMWPSPHLAT